VRQRCLLIRKLKIRKTATKTANKSNEVEIEFHAIGSPKDSERSFMYMPFARSKPSSSRADVGAILAKLDQEQDEDYDWKSPIVDLMKLLKLDIGLGARKQLAKELGYTGALDGSAEMNVWLHKQVMTKLAETGGKVPDSLKT
jgi:hypothetical protein